MKVDAFTYSLMNNTDPVTGRPIKAGFDPNALYKVDPTRGMPGSGGPSKYMYGYREGMNYEEVRSAAQPLGSSLINGLIGKVAIGTIGKIGEGAGFILNSGQIFKQDGDITAALDNGISNFFEGIQTWADEEMPIYKGREYQGNFFSKMGTDDFWFNDGFDALAFMLSAYVPGAAATKLGSLAQVGKLASVINSGSKYVKAAKLANALKAVTAGQIEAGFGMTLGTAYNTVSESAFEAKDIYDQIYQQQLPKLGEQGAKKAASEAASRVFTANMAGLLIPNAIQSSFFHSSPAAALRKLQTAVRSGANTGELLGSLGKDISKAVGTGIVSEGLWEENFQNAVQRYERRFADDWAGNMAGEYAYGLKLGLSGMLKAFIPGVQTQAGTDEDEALTAVALGGIMGGGMGITSALRERKQTNKQLDHITRTWNAIKEANSMGKQFLVDNYTVGLKEFGTEDVLDAEGKPTGEKRISYINPNTGQSEIDPQKVQNNLLRKTKDAALALKHLQALMTNNKSMLDYNKEMALMSYAWHLQSIPGLTSEDIEDLIKYDVQLPMSKELATDLDENFLAQNIEKIHDYMKLYRTSTSAVGGMFDFSQETVDKEFGAMMKRAYYYTAAKKRAIENMMKDASDTAKESMQATVDGLDAHLKSFSKNINKYYDNFVREVLPGIERARKLDQISIELGKEDITDEDKAKLLQEIENINYLHKEAVYADNFYVDKLFNKRPSEFFSNEFVEGDMAIHDRANGRTMAPLSEAERFYYADAMDAIFEQELRRDVMDKATPLSAITDKIFNRPDRAIPEDVYTDIKERAERERIDAENQSRSEIAATAKRLINSKLTIVDEAKGDIIKDENDARQFNRLMTEDRQYIEAGLQALGSTYTSKDIMDNPNMIVDFYRDLDNMQKEDEKRVAKANAMKAGFESRDKAFKDVLDERAKVKNMTPEARQEYFRRNHFMKETAQVRSIIDEFKKDPKNFSKNVDVLIGKLVGIKNVFQSREDISDEFKKEIIDLIDGYLDVLKDAKIAATKNIGKRYEIQKLAEVAYEESLKNVLNRTDVIEFLSDFIPNIKDMLKEVEEYSRKQNSKEGYEAILEIARRRLPAEKKREFFQKIIELSNTRGDEFRENLRQIVGKSLLSPSDVLSGLKGEKRGPVTFTSDTLSYFLVNPYGLAMNLINNADVLGKRTGRPIDGPIDIYQRFRIDKDFYRLYYDIQDNAYQGLTEAEKQAVNLVFNLVTDATAYHTIATSVLSDVDASKLYTFEATEASNAKYFPTVQQAISVRQAIHQLSNKEITKNRSVIFGIYGSGKTAMVARKVMHFLVPAQSRKAKILAFAQAEKTSEKIAESVGGTQTDLASFLAMTEKDKVDYLVIDEAFTFLSSQIREVLAKAERLDIKVLMLGDPSQNKSEDTVFLENNIGVPKAQPLTVVLRTNNPAITAFANTFQYEPNAVPSVIVTATSTLENRASQDTGVWATDPTRNAEEHIVELVKKSNSKDIMIITNHNIDYYKQQLGGLPHVEIVTPKQAQGREKEEVYVDISRSGMNVNGGALNSDLEFNTMMATSASRAIKSVIIARRPGLNMQANVESRLADTITELTAEFDKYKRDYLESLQAYKYFLNKFAGIKLEDPKTKQEDQKDDEHTDDVGETTDKKHTDPKTQEPIPVPDPIEGDFNIANPQSENSRTTTVGKGFIVRAVFEGESVEKERWVVMAPANDVAEAYRVIGVLNREEIERGGFTAEDRVPAGSLRNVFSMSPDKTQAYKLDDFADKVIRGVEVRYIKPINFDFSAEPVDASSSHIDNVITDFYGQETPGNIRLRIYTDPTSQFSANKFVPNAGHPYLVFTANKSQDGDKPTTLHIPVNAPKLGVESKTVKHLDEFRAALVSFAAKLKVNVEEYFNSSKFETMLSDFAELYTVDTLTEGLPIIRGANFDTKVEKLQQKHKVPTEALDDLDNIITGVYAAEESLRRVTKEEFEEWKELNPKYAGTAVWTQEKWHKKTVEPEVKLGIISYDKSTPDGPKKAYVTKYTLGFNEGPASKAWAEVAISNNDIAGYFPRTLVYSGNKWHENRGGKKYVAKSFVGSKDSARRAIREIKNILARFASSLNDYRSMIDDIDPERAKALEELWNDLDKYSRTTFGSHELEGKLIPYMEYLTGSETEAPLLPIFKIYKDTYDESGNVVGQETTTIRDAIAGMVTQHVPFSALDFISNPDNFEEGSHTNLFHNLNRKRDGSITMDMDDQHVDADSILDGTHQFTTTVSQINPTTVTLNYDTSAKQQPEDETLPPPPADQMPGEVHTGKAEVSADLQERFERQMQELQGVTTEEAFNDIIAQYGDITEDNLKIIANLTKIYTQRGAFEQDEDEDFFNRKQTIFARTIPGSLKSMEWAKAVLQKILPGLNIEAQVRFLDNLQMSIFETKDKEILGRVFKAVMDLKKTEDGKVYDQVVYHEAFHMAWRYLFDDKTKDRLRRSFRNTYGRNFTDAEIHEGLAELYQRYEERAVPKGFISRIIFEIKRFFGLLANNKAYIERVFFDLDQGKYSESVTAKEKEGSPNNFTYIEDNFGSIKSYLNALTQIKSRLYQYLEHHSKASNDPIIRNSNLPMTRTEIFDAIFKETVEEYEAAKLAREFELNRIKKQFNVEGLRALKDRKLNAQRVIDNNIGGAESVIRATEDLLAIEKAFKQYEAMDNQYRMYRTLTDKNVRTNKYVLYEMFENMYPSYNANEEYNFELDALTEDEALELSTEDKEALGVSESADVHTVLEAFEALRAETIDTNRINWAAKQSLALKDFFSFIPLLNDEGLVEKDSVGHTKLINSKVAYVRGLLLIEQLDLNSPYLLEEIKYLYDQGLDRWDRSVLNQISKLFGELRKLEERHDNYSIVARTYDLKSNVDYYLFETTDPEVDAHSVTYDEAKELVNRDSSKHKLTKAPDNSIIKLYDKTNLTAEELRDIFVQKEAINTIANLQSFIGSMKNTEYRMTVRRVLGKNRSVSNVTARGNDQHINNRAIIREAFVDGFLSEDPIYNQTTTINNIKKNLESNKPALWKAGIINLLNLLGVQDVFPHMNPKLLAENRIAIKSMLDTLTRSALPLQVVMTIEDGVEKSNEAIDFNTWIDRNNPAIVALSKLVQVENEQPRSTSIISVKKQKIYKHTLTNPIYKNLVPTIAWQTRHLAQNVSENLLKLPKHLQILSKINPFLQVDPDGKAKLRMYEIFEFDGYKNKPNTREYGTDYLRFDKHKLHTSYFAASFLDRLQSGTYDHILYQQADKPRPVGVRVGIIGDAQLEELIDQMVENINYFTDGNRGKEFQRHSAKYELNKYVNADILQKIIGEEDKVSAFKREIAKEAIKLALELAESRIEFVGSEAQKTALLNHFHKGNMLKHLNDALAERGFPAISDVEVLAEKARTGDQYHATAYDFMPYAYGFLINHYVNAYFANQLAINSSQFFGSGKTVVKRMTGSAGPGHYAWIHPRFGVKETVKVAVVGDDSSTANEVFSSVLKAMYNPVKGREEEFESIFADKEKASTQVIDELLEYFGNTENESEKQDLTILRDFFGVNEVDRTDGQVFATPARLRNLQKGFGREFRLANIQKPKYFGPRFEKWNNEDLVIQTYIKPSTVILSDELLLDKDGNVRQGFEVLMRIRRKMENAGIEELAFGSAVKVGKPAVRHSFEELLNEEIPLQKGIINIQSDQYQIQLNPRSKIDTKIALFSQLTYFLNIYSSSPTMNNVEQAKKVYSAIAYLLEKGGIEFQKKFDDFSKTLQKAFSDRAEDVIFADMLANGVSPTSPIFEKKALIKMASVMEQVATKIKLPGAKLVLQTEAGVNNPITNKPLRFYRNESGKLVAEVIVPRKLFPDNLAAEIEQGKDLFENPVLLGFRIPSTELHSAVAMKVVGFYDTKDTNMIIAPELLVALHGSDFDVDSLFIAKRPIANKDVRVSSKEDIEGLMSIMAEIDKTLEAAEKTNSPAFKDLYDAYRSIKKTIVAKKDAVTAREYDELNVIRVQLDIERDFQAFVAEYNINITLPEQETKARLDYSDIAGLSWLEKKDNTSPITPNERKFSKFDNEIRNARRWRIRTQDTYALFDVKRKLHNLRNNEAAMSAFPNLARDMDSLFKGIRNQRVKPSLVFASKGDLIGFERVRDKFVFQEDYDATISEKLQELEDLRKKAHDAGYKNLEQILSRQYKDLVSIKEDYYKGTIVDVFLDTISDPKNIVRMMRPISKSYLVGRGKDKQYHSSSAIYTVAQLGLVDESDVDLSNYNDVYPAFKSVSDMAILTGIFANAIKVLAYIGRSGVSDTTRKMLVRLEKKLRNLEDATKIYRTWTQGTTPSPEQKQALEDIERYKKEIKADQAVIKDVLKQEQASSSLTDFLPKIAEDKAFYYKVGKKAIFIDRMSEFVHGTENRVSIYDVLDALVNIAIDNIKDQELFALQATLETGNIWTALISMGIPAEDIIMMMYSPFIQKLLELVRFNSRLELDDLTGKFRKAVETRLSETTIPEDFKEYMNPKSTQNQLNALSKKTLNKFLTDGKYSGITVKMDGQKLDVTGLDSLNELELADILRFMTIFNTAAKLGDNLRNLSSFLSILRDLPISFDGIQDIEEALGKLGDFQKNEEEFEKLDFADYLSQSELMDVLDNLSSTFLTKQNESIFKIEGLFLRNPHILSAYRRFLQLKQTIEKKFAIYNPILVDYLKDMFSDVSSDAKKNSVQQSLRWELRRLLLTQVIDRQFADKKHTRSYLSSRTGRRSTIDLYGTEAWGAKFVDTVKLVKQKDMELAKAEGRAPNPFLEALYIDNGKMQFNFDLEVDRAMLNELRRGFVQLGQYTFTDGYLNFNPSTPKSKKGIELNLNKSRKVLQDYDIEYGFSEFQKDFAFYLAMVDGMRFSANNYSAAIHPKLIAVLTNKLNTLEERLLTDLELRNKLETFILNELLRENNAVVGSYIHQDDKERYLRKEGEESENEEQGDDRKFTPRNGVYQFENGRKVFYDMAFDNPFNEEELQDKQNRNTVDRKFPKFVTTGFGDEIEVMVRVTEETDPVLAYIKLGKATGSYTKIENLDDVQNVSDNFKANMPTQYVKDLKSNSFVTPRNYSYLESGEPLRLVQWGDRGRVIVREVTIVSQEPNIIDRFGKEVQEGFKYVVKDFLPAPEQKTVTLARKQGVIPQTIHRIEKIEDAKAGATMPAITLLEEIIKSDKVSEKYKKLAQELHSRLFDKALNPPVIFSKINLRGNNTPAYFHNAYNLIVVDPAKFDKSTPDKQAHYIIHELVHAETQLLFLAAKMKTGKGRIYDILVNTYPGIIESLDEFEKNNEEKLNRLATTLQGFTHTARKQLSEAEGKMYGFTDGFEMLAEFGSNPEFREVTKKVIIKKSSLYSRIIQAIMDFLTDRNKLTKNGEVTLYDILENLLEVSDTFDNMSIAPSQTRVSKQDEDLLEIIKNVGATDEKAAQEMFFAELADYYGFQLTNEDLDQPLISSLIQNIVTNSHTTQKTEEKIKDLEEFSKPLENTPDERNYIHKITKRLYRRVTDEFTGFVADFLRNPSTESNIREQGMKRWEGHKPEDKLETQYGVLDMEGWIAKKESIMNKGKLKGTIIHKLIEKYVKGDPDGKLSNEIADLMLKGDFVADQFGWVAEHLTTILKRAQINVKDDKMPEDRMDKLVAEKVLYNDILEIAGTADLFVFHSDGTISIKDFKAAYSLFEYDSNELLMFGDQGSADKLILNTYENKAYLQIVTYALLYKLQNPYAKFSSLDVLWMPDEDAVFSDRFRNVVHVEPYLNMIHQVLKTKHPEKYQKLKDSMSAEDWNKVWNPKEYRAGYSKNVREQLHRGKDTPINEQIQAKLQRLRELIMSDLNPNTYDQARLNNKEDQKLVKALMKEIFDLQQQATDLNLNVESWRSDMSDFQNWLFTASTTNNPFIQTWEELYFAKRKIATEKGEAKRKRFLSLVDPIKKIYLQNHGMNKLIHDITRGGADFINARDLYKFAYVPIYGEDNIVIDYKLRTTDKEFDDLVKNNEEFAYINERNIHYYKNLLKFVNEEYKSFFEGEGNVANRIATYTMSGKPLTNMDLYNGKRVRYDKSSVGKKDELFEYKDGFFFKVPPLLSEFNVGQGKYWDVWKQRNLTFAEEFKFEGYDKKAFAEGLPMKYLGSRHINSNPDYYSLNLEYQFDRATKAYYWKEAMDDVFAYGQGLRILMNSQKGDVPKNLVDFMKRELDMKIRVRPKYTQDPEKMITKNRYNVNLVKVLSKLRHVFNYPLLGLNYIGGTANGIFTMMLTHKTGLQNTLLRREGNFAGINADEWDYSLKDLQAAWPEVLNVAKEGMMGNVRNSKAYLLAKKFGYFPNSFDWSVSPHNITTSGNRIFNSDSLFLFYSLPEETVALLVMVAQLKSMKITHGALAGTSLYDMYEEYEATDENGNKYKDIRWKNDPTTNKPYLRAVKNLGNGNYDELYELDEKEIRRLYSAYDKQHGGYRQQDKMMLDYTIMGQLALQFRRYLPHILRQGAASSGKRSNLGYYKVTGKLEDGTPTVEWVSKVMEGRWAVLGKTLLRAINAASVLQKIPEDAKGLAGRLRRVGMSLEDYDWNQLDVGQQEALVDAWVTLMIVFMGYGASLFVGGDAGNDDPMWRITNRIFNDLTQMYNPQELFKNITTWDPVSLAKFRNLQADSFKVMMSAIYWSAGDEERAFTPQGRLEGINQLMKDLPITSAIRKTEDLMTSEVFSE